MVSNADWLKRRQGAVPRGVATAAPIFIDRAENATLWDADGREYIDFAGGIAVVNTGHRHPKVIAAVEAQLARVTHAAFQVSGYDVYVELAERLNKLAPIEGEAQTIFFTTGAEAVENAIKTARAATGRQAVIAFSGAFHGRTALTMALTGKAVPYKHQFGPSAPDVFHVPFPVARYGVDVEASLNILAHVLRADVDASRVAAIILEPVQGEGGFHIAPPELMRGLRQICDSNGILLIADEVQTGFARTGRLFAMEHYDVKADIMTMAKSLAGGFPLSAVTGRKDVMDKVEPGGLGGTYGGSPIGCAAALAVLDVIEEEYLIPRAVKLGDRALARLDEMSKRNDLYPIDSVRGLGSMVAFDIVTTRGGREGDGAAVKRVTAKALDEGLLLLGCGVFGESLRLLYPLTIPDAQFDEGMNRLERALKA